MNGVNENGVPFRSILINNAVTNSFDAQLINRSQARNPGDPFSFMTIGIDAGDDRVFREGFGFNFFRISSEENAPISPSNQRRAMVINGFTGELLANIQPGLRDAQIENQEIIDAINSITAPAPADPFVNWAEEQNIPEAERAPDADPDSDGLVNLLEYAYGTNPIEQSQAAAPRLNESGQFVFQRSKTADVAPFVIMTSSSLEPESFQPFTPTNGMNVTDQGDTELVTMELPREDRLFVRLEISRSE